jgi:lipopolysaccharide/colanic/teichoic acid biosynthesis glycosyltransferase
VSRAASEADWEATLPTRAAGSAWRAGHVVKRLIDIIVAAAALLALLPLFVVLGAAIVIDSGWPVFYPWRVVGLRGRRFTGYKLRTMVPDADQLKDQLAHLNEMDGPVFKIRTSSCRRRRSSDASCP